MLKKAASKASISSISTQRRWPLTSDLWGQVITVELRPEFSLFLYRKKEPEIHIHRLNSVISTRFVSHSLSGLRAGLWQSLWNYHHHQVLVVLYVRLTLKISFYFVALVRNVRYFNVGTRDTSRPTSTTNTRWCCDMDNKPVTYRHVWSLINTWI